MAIKQVRYRVTNIGMVDSTKNFDHVIVEKKTLASPGFSSINRLEFLRRARSPGQSYLPSGFGRALCANDHHDMDHAQTSMLSQPLTSPPPVAFIMSGCAAAARRPRESISQKRLVGREELIIPSYLQYNR